MSLEWDAEKYEAISTQHVRWGRDLLNSFLERRPLRGDESVIDAGCGTGRVTELLLERLPEGEVLAVDASEEMVRAAGERFAGDPRVRVEWQDIRELEVGKTVDGILSTATFHWIVDHEALFRRLAAVLKPGGWLVAQCGGAGNISRVRRATEEIMRQERFRGYFAGREENKEYADPATTEARLEAAGFEQIEAWLHEEPTEFAPVEELTRFLRTVALREHVEALPETKKDDFAASVAGEFVSREGAPVIDFVRLNIVAKKSGDEEVA